MVKTYNCSFNRNIYLWWCSNVYKKRLQSFIGTYFYCAFLGSSLGMDSNVHPGVGKFGCNWLEWWKGIWRQIFEKYQIPKSPPYALPSPRQLNIDRCPSLICRIWLLVILLDMKRLFKGISMKFLIKKPLLDFGLREIEKLWKYSDLHEIVHPSLVLNSLCLLTGA